MPTLLPVCTVFVDHRVRGPFWRSSTATTLNLPERARFGPSVRDHLDCRNRRLRQLSGEEARPSRIEVGMTPAIVHEPTAARRTEHSRTHPRGGQRDRTIPPSCTQGAPLSTRALLSLQRTAGNHAVGEWLSARMSVQPCGEIPTEQCSCHNDESSEPTQDTVPLQLTPQPQSRVGQAAVVDLLDAPSATPTRTAVPGASGPARVQRRAGGCGIGSGGMDQRAYGPVVQAAPESDASVTPATGCDERCTPFEDPAEAQRQWSRLQAIVPQLTSRVTGCVDVKAVWEAYFAGTSQRFPFSSGCIIEAAKTDELAARMQKVGAYLLTKDIVRRLPVLLRDIVGGPGSVLRLPLAQAIGPGERQERHLHPPIIYNTVKNAAANLAGDIGGSDIFGNDDRVISGEVVITANRIDPDTGAITGHIRWVPHVHVIDTVDLCPGNLGTTLQEVLTVPMCRLEVMGLTKDVPITFDYDLDPQAQPFTDVQPLIGPLPGPQPRPAEKFPRVGPATTTGSLLRIRTAPSLQSPTVGLLGERGTQIQVETQVRGDPVDGNDVWDKVPGGFVSHRFVEFTTPDSP